MFFRTRRIVMGQCIYCGGKVGYSETHCHTCGNVNPYGPPQPRPMPTASDEPTIVIVLEPSPEEKFADRPEFTPESLHQTAMIGTPEEVIERLRHYEALGVTEFSLWSDNSLTHEEKKRSLELFSNSLKLHFRW